MNYDEDEDGSEDDVAKEADDPLEGQSEAEEGFGDDFDDFEAGAGDEDFGDFDEGFEQSPEPQTVQESREPPKTPAPIPESPFVSSYILTVHISLPTKPFNSLPK